MKDINIPAGYKSTDIGVIPEDWEINRLGEKTIKIGSGITPTGGEKVYKKEGRPFLRSQNIAWGHLSLDDIAFINDEIHNIFKATEIKKLDVFLNITGASIGRSAVADYRVENGNVNQHVCIIRTNQKELNSFFLNHYLLSYKGQKQIDSFQAGGNREGLNFGQIKSLKIPLPPLPEQKAIATALLDIDNLLEVLDRLIAKKQNLKQSAMQQLLTGKQRLPGFKDEWNIKRLANVLTICHGRSQHEVQVEDGLYPILATGGQIGRSRSFLYDKPSVLIGRKGTINQPQYMDTPFWTVDTLFYSIIHNANNAKFIFYRFCLIDWNQYNEASGVPSLNARTIESIEVKLPQTEKEQKAIANILSDMDTEIAALKKRRDKTHHIKQAMMQELLTGKTRLVSPGVTND